HSPSKYLVHGFSSTVGRTIEAWNNKDFYGNEVFDDRHPTFVRLLEGMLHAMGPPIPFSAQGAMRAGEQGLTGAQMAAPFGGFKIAPRSYQETPWESYVSGELERKYGTTPPRRPEEAELHEQAKEARERAALGLPPAVDIGKTRLAQIYRSAQRPPLERRAEAMTLK